MIQAQPTQIAMHPTIFNSPPKPILSAEQKAQNQLLEAWLKGDLALVRKLETQGALLLNPAQVTLKYFQQVEAMAKTVQDKIDPKELSTLLKDVTEGHLVNVENRLKKTPALALGIGTITDRSDRMFKNITALQYAAWALDSEMCELIMSYAGAHNSAIQLKALSEEPQRYSSHGASYDFTPLVTKTKTYMDNYAKWNYDTVC